MGLSSLLGVLEQYRNANASAPPPNVEQHYSQVAEQAPQEHLASGLAEAFHSNQTPPFGQMISTLFSNSDAQQKAGILEKLLKAVEPELLSSGALSGLGRLVQGGQANVTPDQANQVSPEAVQKLAEHAEKRNPSIVEEAGAFYSQHPALVKKLGAGALVLIMSHIARR